MNKNIFKEIANDELSLSPLMSGREKLDTEELLGKEATVIAFDFASITDKGEVKTFPVLLLKEYPNNYYNGGALLMKVCSAWAAEFDGDVEKASQELTNCGGVKLAFKSTRTKNGNNLTAIEVL